MMDARKAGELAARNGLPGDPPPRLKPQDRDEWFEGWLNTPGRPETGDEVHARNCAETPLIADAILRLVWDNIDYFGDSYYHPITRPIYERVGEYMERYK
jgi:hypothetical protein